MTNKQIKYNKWDEDINWDANVQLAIWGESESITIEDSYQAFKNRFIAELTDD